MRFGFFKSIAAAAALAVCVGGCAASDSVASGIAAQAGSDAAESISSSSAPSGGDAASEADSAPRPKLYAAGDYVDTMAEGTTVEIVNLLEGDEEKVDGVHISGTIGLCVDYDTESFDYCPAAVNNGVMLFTSPYNDGKADVSLAVEQVDAAQDPDSVLEAALPGGCTAEQDTAEIGGETAKVLRYATGEDWNSLCGAVYYVAFEGRAYRLTAHYFLEAAEGYGVRIGTMLNSMRFLPKAE